MPPPLSAAICTHNPRAEYLAETLDALRRQTIAADAWELVVVDNGSDNGGCEHLDLAWHSRAGIVRENQLGLTHARIRAIAETRGEMILFIDDDNVLAQDYIETLLRLAQEFPNLGCFGAGRILPRYEVEPPAELTPYLPMLALRDEPVRKWSNLPHDWIVPWGAGLAARRAVARGFVEAVTQSPLRQYLGRKGAELNSGEDDEFSYVACSLGFGKGLFPELEVTHLIDRKRIDRDYLLRVAEGHAFSHAILDALHGKLPPATARPGLGAVLRNLSRGSLSGFLAESQRLWRHLHMNPLSRQFEQAQAQGVERARSLAAALPDPGHAP